MSLFWTIGTVFLTLLTATTGPLMESHLRQLGKGKLEETAMHVWENRASYGAAVIQLLTVMGHAFIRGCTGIMYGVRNVYSLVRRPSKGSAAELISRFLEARH